MGFDHELPIDMLTSSSGSRDMRMLARATKVARYGVLALAVAASATEAAGAGSQASLSKGRTEPALSLVPPPREAARIFVSGHSLTDRPLPDYLATIADSLGTPAVWNQQNLFGSSIRERIRGRGAGETGWVGYSQGENRDGQGLNVINELRRPQTIDTDRYDALIITEQHTLLGSLIWNDTVRYLRHFHDRIIEGNPQATTYLYHSWISLNDKDNPNRWIAYEREALSAWQCVAARINQSLAAEGRTDRISSLPAAAALAALVERATQGAGLPGISGESVRQTMERLFRDDVHLTPLGTYYIALVSYAIVYRRSPLGAWAPSEIDQTQTATLQQMAWTFVTDIARDQQANSLEACRAIVSNEFVYTYWSYIRDTYWRQEGNTIQAYAKWLQHLARWRYRLSREDEDNPLYYSAAHDRTYWYSPPD
ncbi:hypothetical protein [Microvirga makkahensis]|uniref:Uncharacterized protein n=1 Tax=Microvirga makkahensis TaxID=1128670 RepID=A0A7X3MV18_9HYPH|nr:hypothetical protein [Microvirga makkahensis]MXQ13734.1 hypothetical protein [Microvirga makkahensis]